MDKRDDLAERVEELSMIVVQQQSEIMALRGSIRSLRQVSNLHSIVLSNLNERCPE